MFQPTLLAVIRYAKEKIVSGLSLEIITLMYIVLLPDDCQSNRPKHGVECFFLF